MVTSSPAILDCAIENIQGKISDLRELGFANPANVPPGELRCANSALQLGYNERDSVL
jgi:hypothetical protein